MATGNKYIFSFLFHMCLPMNCVLFSLLHFTVDVVCIVPHADFFAKAEFISTVMMGCYENKSSTDVHSRYLEK